MLDPIPLHPNSRRDQRSPSSNGPAPRTAFPLSPSKPPGFDLQPRTRAVLTPSYTSEVILNPAASVIPPSTTTQVNSSSLPWWRFSFSLINEWNTFIWHRVAFLESDSWSHARLRWHRFGRGPVRVLGFRWSGSHHPFSGIPVQFPDAGQRSEQPGSSAARV